MNVRLHLKMLSYLPGYEGTFELWCEREFQALPRKGEQVELAEGPDGRLGPVREVRAVNHLADGGIVVQLTSYNRSTTDEYLLLCELADAHGWRWFGKSPEKLPLDVI